MSFNKYVKNYLGEDSPEGDFAKDWGSDKRKPSIKTKRELISYLKNKDACIECIEIAGKMFSRYTLMWLEKRI